MTVAEVKELLLDDAVSRAARGAPVGAWSADEEQAVQEAMAEVEAGAPAIPNDEVVRLLCEKQGISRAEWDAGGEPHAAR